MHVCLFFLGFGFVVVAVAFAVYYILSVMSLARVRERAKVSVFVCKRIFRALCE